MARFIFQPDGVLRHRTHVAHARQRALAGIQARLAPPETQLPAPAAGGIAYLSCRAALTNQKVGAIKLVIFPPATQPVEEKKDQPDPATQPTYKLEELLAKVSGRPAGEQVEFMQHIFDAQMAQLD